MIAFAKKCFYIFLVTWVDTKTEQMLQHSAIMTWKTECQFETQYWLLIVQFVESLNSSSTQSNNVPPHPYLQGSAIRLMILSRVMLGVSSHGPRHSEQQSRARAHSPQLRWPRRH